MFITIMNGIKPKKFPLNLTKEAFISRMKFHSDEEKEKCEKYLDLKGVEYHIVLANFIGPNVKGKVEYKKVSCLYQYDKRIRNILYSYLSAFEEGIRAFLCNEYSLNIKLFRKISRAIVKKVNQGSSLSRELESLDLNILLQISLKLAPEEKTKLFGPIENLDINLSAVRELRNAVSHHRLLFVYEDFDSCFVNGVEMDTLQANVMNLMNLLNPYYKKFFRDDINKAINDEKDKAFCEAIPKNAALNIPEISTV